MGKIGIELKWAAIITLYGCVWAAMEKALGYHEDFSNIMVTAFLYFVILTFLWAVAFIDKKKSLGKNTDWDFKRAFKFGLFLTGLTAILSPIAQYIIYESISPDYFNNVIQHQLSQGRQTLESLEAINNLDFMIRQGVMNALSLGVIYSALYAWVFKAKTVEKQPIEPKIKKSKK